MTDSTTEQPPAVTPHHCQTSGCGKWGGFGFDRLEGGQKKTDWWCWGHYPYKDPPLDGRVSAARQ